MNAIIAKNVVIFLVMFVFVKKYISLQNTENYNMKTTVKSMIYQGEAELSLATDDLLVSALFVADSATCVPEELSGAFAFHLTPKYYIQSALRGGSVMAGAAGFFVQQTIK